MIKELIKFVLKEKKWWILPPIIMIILFSLLITFSSVSPISSFIYMMF